MNHIELLKKDLADGFSKSELETLIGLPQNVLSGIISGKRSLSKKSKLKIERFMTGAKPDPLKLEPSKIKIQDLTTGNTNQVKAITDAPPKSNKVISNNNDRYPGRLNGEGVIDYKIRMSEKQN